MARRPDSAPATETLQEIESVFDRVAGWVASNPSRFLALVGVALGTAAVIGGLSWWGERQEAEASTAVARVVAEYRAAMGVPPGSEVIVEPANPEVARAAREEAVEDLLEVAGEHAGSVSALPAYLEAGNLRTELGDLEGALAAWQQGVDQAPGDSAVLGLLLSRLGRGLEEAGRWEEAAATHARAAEIEDYPARHYALADAARSYAEAGDTDQAVALFDRLESEAPEIQIPDHVRARLRELRLAGR